MSTGGVSLIFFAPVDDVTSSNMSFSALSPSSLETEIDPWEGKKREGFLGRGKGA